MDSAAGLLEDLNLLFDDRSPYAPFAILVPRQTFLQRNMEQEKNAGDPVSPRQREQAPPGRLSQSRRIDDAQPVNADPLFHDVMKQRECLLRVSLVPLVVRDQLAALVG
jgi:hypothetical protein